MESDAPHTEGGESGQAQAYSGKRGDVKYFIAYVEATQGHGQRSPEAKAAVQDAIDHGWSPDGLAQELKETTMTASTWPDPPTWSRR